MSPPEPSLTYQASWFVEPELAIFKDHFPGMPIVPAYLQLARIRDEVSHWLQCSVSRVKVKGMKYRGHIIPGCEVVMSFERSSAEQLISVTLSVNGELVTNGQLALL